MQVNPSTAELRLYRGTVSLFSPDLPIRTTLHTKYKSKSDLDDQAEEIVEGRGHITLLTASEYKVLKQPRLEVILRRNPFDDIYLLGEKTSRDVQFVAVVWSFGNRWREEMGLTPKDFHVTLSEVDNRALDGERVGIVVRQMKGEEGVERIRKLGLEAMNHVLGALGSGAMDRELARRLAEFMIIDHPSSHKGFVRLAEVSRHLPKLHILASVQAAARKPELLPAVRKRIIRLRWQATIGPACTSVELDCIATHLRSILTAPWPRIIVEDEVLRRTLCLYLIVPRERQIYFPPGPGSETGYELPRYFSWIYPFRIAGMSTPRNELDIDTLISMGFTDILSLTLETPLPKEWFHLKKIKQTFVPLKNYMGPTAAEMDIIYDKVKEGGVWLVHCGGGLGRAGTILACLIAMLGESSDDGVESTTTTIPPSPKLDAGTAIRLLRTSRPRSLESDSQESFVSDWISHRWKLVNWPINVEEPATCLVDSDITGEPIDLAAMDGVVLVMIGKPGSGKSWLAECISRRRPPGQTVIISQDESGSRAMSETELSRQYPAEKLVILDRCNPRQEDRRLWLKLTDRRKIAVYFDCSKAVCKRRIDTRLNHPTLRAGRGDKALDQMDREMAPPQLDEGFSTILRITSFGAARQAVLRMTAPIPLLKFPRTPHLLELGSKGEDDFAIDIFNHSSGKLEGRLTIEEKIDGANMGISLGWDMGLVVQNRSHWIQSDSHAQFKSLDLWLDKFRTTLANLLLRDEYFPERYILYGEWMAARHSIGYTALPDRFIAFDLYDRLSGTYWSRGYVDRVLEGTGIAQVPCLGQRDEISKNEILEMIQRPSAFIDGHGNSPGHGHEEGQGGGERMEEGKEWRAYI